MDAETRRRLWRDHRIWISEVNVPHFQKGMRAEPCTSFSRNSTFQLRSVGAFSYFGNRVDIGNTRQIGRYCSFGGDILVGAGPHPFDWVSSSNFFFRKPSYHQHPNASAFFEDREIPPFKHGKQACEIGHDVWCGSKAMIMMDVNVGTGAVVGGGAVVTKDVPPYAIVAGNPARIVRFRFDEATIDRLLRSEWWTIKPGLLGDVDMTDPSAALDRIDEIKAGDDWRFAPASVQLGL